MAEYVDSVSPGRLAGAEERIRSGARAVAGTTMWERIALIAVVVASAFLELFRLDKEGYANTYYAAAVKSMMQSWHNFFYVSFDPGGFVTVDKPPVALWIQVLSAKVFGFSGVSILLPQALATVLSVALLYYLVRRAWGPIPGLVAALALAVMPVTVATGRNNTMDSVLVLIVLLAAWAVVRAAETGRIRWLLLTAVLMGIGFNTKMLEAYLVLPALGLLYLVAAPRSWSARILHLIVATAVLLVVSASWAAAVDLTPASQRPYVGSSSNNTETNLILGYNGLNRFQQGLYGSGGAPGFGGRRGGGFAGRGFGAARSGVDQTNAANGWFFGTGQPGPTRLFSAELIGQIGWLLPLAFLGLIVAALQNRRRWPLDRRQQSVVLWGMWLLTQFVYFSVANRFQSYYLVMMAPAIAALFGIGLASLWRLYRQHCTLWWVLPLVFVAMAGYQAYVLSPYSDWRSRLDPVVAGVCLVAAVALLAARLIRSLPARAAASAAVAGMAALLVAPTVWAAIPVWNGSSSRPVAGPGASGPSRFGVRDSVTTNATLVRYLEAHRGNARFLVGMPSAMEAAPYILATGEPVMALGGFSGADNILTPSSLATLVRQGKVRYFLLPGPIDRRALASFFGSRGGGSTLRPSSGFAAGPTGSRGFSTRGGGFGFFGRGRQSSVTVWVTSHCRTVPSSLWQSSNSSSASGAGPAGFFERGGSQKLYDCARA